MKKKLVSLLALAMAGCMALTGCGSNGGASADGGSKATTLKFGTGGTSGTYYAFGGVLAGILNEKVDGLTVKVLSTGASKANIFNIADGENDMAVVQNDVMYYAYNGTDLFEADGAITDFSAVAGLYAEVCQIVATPDIKSVADLKGKSVSVGDAGSGVEFNAHQILEAYGLSTSDITVQNLSFSDSAEALKDGKISAFFCTAGAPTTAVVELATSNDITLVEVDDEHAKVLMDQYPFYTQYSIPGGTYKGVDNDAKTVAVKATLIASNKVDEDTVYNITKAIFENKDAIASGHAKGAELDTAYAVDGIPVPFHAGAEKYFKEIGAIQ